MSNPLNDDLDVMAAARVSLSNEKGVLYGEKTREVSASSEAGSHDDEPTMEEMKTLRRVSGKIPWQAYTVTFVEFCERFSYYGTTAVFVNFIQQPRPFGSRTGNWQPNETCYNAPGWDVSSCEQAGGLGQSQQASTGLTVSLDASHNVRSL